MSRLKNPDRTWVERSKNVLAQSSPGTNSKRWTQYVDGVYPSHTNGTGLGPYLHDAWGNKYIDFICGLGSVSLGYSNQNVNEAVIRQVMKGATHSLPTTLEVEVAEMISSIIPSAEKIRFLKTGNEAACAAIRIARSYTGKPYILNDGYHGHADIFTSLTEPSIGVAEKFRIVNNFHLDADAAAVMVEAAKLDLTEKWQKEITDLRQKCRENNVLFIIDEIVTGFRVPKWTVSNLWNLDPDIILLGKGIANGYPLAVVAGKKEIMDCSEYFISSTFSGEAVSLAAAKATIEEIQQKSLDNLMFYGQRLQDKLNTLHPDIKFEGYGTRAMLNMTNPTTALFAQEMCKAGFLFGKGHFFNFSHLEANLEQLVMNSAEGVVDQIKKGNVKLEGVMPVETFRR